MHNNYMARAEYFFKSVFVTAYTGYVGTQFTRAASNPDSISSFMIDGACVAVCATMAGLGINGIIESIKYEPKL